MDRPARHNRNIEGTAEAGTNALWPSTGRSKRSSLTTTETRNSLTSHSRASNQFFFRATAKGVEEETTFHAVNSGARL